MPDRVDPQVELDARFLALIDDLQEFPATREPHRLHAADHPIIRAERTPR